MFSQKSQQLKESLLADNNQDQVDIVEETSLGAKVYDGEDKTEVQIKDEEDEGGDDIQKEIDQIQKEIDWSFKEGELNFANKLFPQFQFRNNIKVPFTYTLIEDAMYVDEGVVVSLEYYVFNNEQDHIHLTDINEVGMTEENVLRLNTDKYQSTGAHPMSIFRNPPKNYVDANKDYLQNPKLGKLMTAVEPEIKKSFKISGVLSFWRAEIYGALEKMCEKSFTHECEFAYTSQGNMTLQITNDRKLLTLTYISKYGDKNEEGNGLLSSDSQVKIMAWAVDVKQYKFTQTLDNKFLYVNDGLSQYLQQNAQEIRLIKSFKVTASFKYVILTYNQQKLISKNQEQSYPGAETSKKGQKFQIATKFAIFEVKSGKLVFEFGGFTPQLKTNDKNKLIYNLGIAIQDVKMTKAYDEYNQLCYEPIANDENINFFCAGDFLDWNDVIRKNKKQQEKEERELSVSQFDDITEIKFTEFDWTLTIKRITMSKIIQSGNTPEQRLEWVNSEIIKHCQQLATGRIGPDQQDAFQFKSKCILLIKNWQAAIIVKVNSHFDQIGVLNIPAISNLENRRLYFLYKTSSNLTQSDHLSKKLEAKNVLDSMPVVIKQLPKEGLILHGRNSQLKRDMYYTVQQRLQRTYAVCLRFQKYEEEELGNLQIQIHEVHQAYNQVDVWCFKDSYMKGPPAINGYIGEELDIPLIENDGRPVIQLCSIDSQNLQIEIMTKIPRKIDLSRYDFFVKSSDSLYQQQGQWPVFAYCLGIEKICLLILQRDKRSRQYYYKCQYGHKFLSFCEFNNYADAGFFAENLLIEGCVKFCFLTKCQNFIYLNILLIDPFHPKSQFSVFTSTYFISKDDFQAKDSIEAAFIIPSKSSSELSGKDKDFQIYCMVQYNSILRRCKFKKTADEIDDDSDFGIDQTDVYDDDMITKANEIDITFLEHVFMQLDEKNFLYYVARLGTRCRIMEINPRRSNFKHHLCIYEWKASKCFALSVEFNGKEFSFIDDTKVTYTLDRQINSRTLQLVSEANFNEMYQQDFNYEEYDPVIMCRQYIIQGNKLFYLESGDPFPNGYLGMEFIHENLKTELPPEFNDQIKWFQGPVIFNGTNQFGTMDRVRKFYAYLNVMALPDSTTKTLMIDNNSQINMSTFLSNGEILLRCAHRYLVFDKEGYFKAQVYFDDQAVRLGEVNQNEKKNKVKKKIVKKGTEKLKKNFMKQHAYDLGLQEEGETSDEFEPDEKTDQHNKMKLIQFSSDNKKFLFLNQLSRQLKVYKFVSRIVKEGKQSDEEYFFKKMYDLEYKYSEILKDSREFMYNEQKKGFIDYLEKYVNINVETDGGLSLVLVSQPDRLLYPDGKFQLFELILSFYKLELRNGVFKVQIFNIKKQFPMPPVEEISDCHSFEAQSIQDRINEVKLVQKRLLPELKDKTDLQIMEDDQEYVESRIRRKINTSFSHDILVIWQGSWLRWTRIKEEFNEDKEKCYRLGELQKLDITFENYSEIIRVMVIKFDQKVESGYKPDKIFGQHELLQILLKVHSSDQSDNKYIIFTWNLTLNYQVQIMEVSDLKNDRLEFNLVKGLNQKLNYFFDSNQITDLEVCIPNQINRNQQEQLRHRSYHQILTRLLRFHHQRKIFFDGSRYLQTKVPQALVFSYSYIQLRQWRDIFFQKNKIQMFQEVVKLEDFLIDFDGQTLFHIYVLNNDVLQYIHDEYMSKKAAGNLTEQEEIVPLMIVMSDQQNYTPLFRAIERQNQKGFELMVEMITDTPNRFISKLIIRSLPKMLRMDSGAVLSFFDNAAYKPIAYQEPIIMPWPDAFGAEPQFFTSKTTLLTQQTILQKFFSKKTVQKEEKKEEVVEEEQKGFETKENKLFNKLKKLKDARDFEFALERGNLDQKSRIREFILREDLQDESLSAQMQGKELDLESESMGTNRRVQVEILDFDFLFQNQNCQVLIQTLAQLESNKILTRKSIKCFVELMWSVYQDVIFYNIFVYYLTYLFLSVYLCSQQLPFFWNEKKRRDAAIAEGQVHETGFFAYVLVIINMVISLRILTFFAQFEFIQLRDSSLLDYFTQLWNLVDFTQMLINTLLLLYTTEFLIFEEHLIPQKSLVRYAAYGNFLMWFKMFYWMRLFKSTAKYVTLITQTLTDLICFMIMVFIIIQAFATFFYIINLNAMEEGLSYLNDYGMPQYLTSVVQIYFVSIGENSYDSFSTGANVKSTWLMFLLATFVNSILFMNMLIAIMGDTFGQVTENEEANGLQQQVALIADYVSLVSASVVWGDTPYVVVVQAVEQTEESEADTGGLLQTMQESIDNKISRLTQTALNKLSSIDEKLDI